MKSSHVITFPRSRLCIIVFINKVAMCFMPFGFVLEFLMIIASILSVIIIGVEQGILLLVMHQLLLISNELLYWQHRRVLFLIKSFDFL